MKIDALLTCVVHISAFNLVFIETGSLGEKEVKSSACKCVQTHLNVIIIMNCTNMNLTTTLPQPANESRQTPTEVYLDNNNISDLTASLLSVYKNFNISILSFHKNSLTNIERGVFSKMKTLQGLDLSGNPKLTESILKDSFYGISNTSMKFLNISGIGLQNISQDFFQNFKDIHNFSLRFKDNTKNYFPVKQLQTLEYLKELYFGSNGLTTFDVESTNFSLLVTIYLDNNEFHDFPDFCFRDDRTSRFPRLQNISIQWNGMRYLNRSHYGCLTKLAHLYLSGNLFDTLRTNQFAQLPNLYRITLSYVGCAIKKVERAVFNNSAIKQIFFRDNHIWFRKEEVDLRMLEDCTGLELLDLNYNVFSLTTQEEFTKLLKNHKTLKVLVMEGCQLSFIPHVITEVLVNIETLILHRNSITDLREHTFDNLTKLKTLFMGENKLSVIKEKSLPAHFVANAVKVEFIANPFSCTCELTWLITWMTKNSSVFGIEKLYYSHLYTCSSPDDLAGHRLLDLDMSEASCLLDQGEKVITLTSSIILIVFLVVGSGLYRYRWHIRYFIYMVRYSQRQELDTGHFDYDAFVAYSSEDRHWVIRTLLPVLETQENLKLCVHDRDFEVGNLIVDNIVDGIEKSRKVMIVLSNNFAKSDWCQFELNFIQRHVLENGQRLLVVVMLEEIETRHVTKAMRVMLQTTTYLLWGEEDYARKAFFNRLRMLLQRPTRYGKKRTLSV